LVRQYDYRSTVQSHVTFRTGGEAEWPFLGQQTLVARDPGFSRGCHWSCKSGGLPQKSFDVSGAWVHWMGKVRRHPTGLNG
jgi:hypothetical protein